MRAREAAAGHGAMLDDPLDDGDKDNARKRCHPRHQLRVLPWAARGKIGVPDEAQKKRGDDRSQRRLKPWSRFGRAARAHPRDDDASDEDQVEGEVKRVHELVLHEADPAVHR